MYVAMRWPISVEADLVLDAGAASSASAANRGRRHRGDDSRVDDHVAAPGADPRVLDVRGLRAFEGADSLPSPSDHRR